MRKTIFTFILTAATLLTFAACSENAEPASTPIPEAGTPAETGNQNATEESEPVPVPEPQTVTITDFDGNEVTLAANPKVAAIYDYAILDILYNIGFEKTGIEMLVVPSKDTLPDELSWYRNQGNDMVINGGTLFYVDWDVLDIVQPELVILGARSFGMNAAGERLSADDNAQFRADTEERYSGAKFVRLSVNARNSNLLPDMERNVDSLAAIFPQIADELRQKFADIKERITEIHTAAQSSGKTALFAMTPSADSMSVFLPESRFDMLYEEFGFIPVGGEAQDWTDQHGFDVRAEYVLEVDPGVIFLLDRSAIAEGSGGAGWDNFTSDPIIARTSAAANGQIYLLSGNAWYTMTGGFTAVETMIADINQFFNQL